MRSASPWRPWVTLPPFLLSLLFLAPLTLNGQADGPANYVVQAAAPGRFPLATGGAPVPLLVGGGDYAGVLRAAGDLRADLGRVTGVEPALHTDTLSARAAVIIGTIGKSPLIDRLVREKKLDVAGVAGRWETFLLEAVDRPLPGIERALVIAGSDKRGTIYGIYDLSGQIGVSPWYWWADAPLRRQPELHVLPGRHTQGEPAVRYRGFFINDEAPALSGWTRATFGGFNHKLYERVFELLLRMKGNYLWPAMWGNAFYDDDTLNAKLAHEYGVVIGTSHHEPLMRAHDEWRRYGKGPWNYQANEAVLREFWRSSIERMGDHESIVTVGMRGDGDEPMSEDRNIAVLEKIVADQREILAAVTGKDPATIPQIWALYKEVQDYYDHGMRVPDDITLLFADDNWGNIRRLPRPGEAKRAGGYGVYYHFDYVGGPRNYKWINTNQIERVWEQMRLAYELGADRIWIVNVGDIKPMEFPLEFFLDLAWNPKRWGAADLPAYTEQWAARQFGAEHAGAIADILARYTKYNSRRKPELLSPATYSLIHYREAERISAEWAALVTAAQRVNERLAPEYRDAFYQLVLHPVTASANLNELYVTVARNRLYAKQGRVLTNALADRAAQLFARDAQISAYYNDTLSGGKWKHMMDQTHISYTYWQQPPKDTMPLVTRIAVPVVAGLGVAVEGSEQWWPGATAPALLPALDANVPGRSYYIEVFNRGAAPFEFSAQPGAPWLRITPARGEVKDQKRIEVSVDWQRAPAGERMVPITIRGPRGQRVEVKAPVVNRPAPPDAAGRHVEANGYIAIEAEQYAAALAAAPFEWIRIPNLGRTLSAMTALPVTERVPTPGGSSPRLEYEIFLADSGSISVHAYLSPSLDFNDLKGLRYGVSVDDEAPQIINALADSSLRGWERAVADNVRLAVSRHHVSRPGAHVVKFWRVDPGVVLQKLVIDAGGLQPSYLGPPSHTKDTDHTKSTKDNSKAAKGGSARFDFFSYESRDPVYRTISADTGSYLNPILPGFYPDPSVVRVGDDYYLVTSSFAYFPGVPIFHSRDLVHWTQIGHVLDRPSQLPVDSLGISRGVFAPMITHRDGTFYMITTLADAGGNLLVTATNPAGPWSEPVWLGFDGIDPSLFFDDDGRAYIVNNGPPIGEPLYQGHRALWLQEYDPKAQKLVGARKLIVNGGVDLTKKPIWIEAPHILKVDGTYYLIAAEGGTAEGHSEVVFRSESVWGPWQPYAGNPILTQRQLDPARQFPITSTGHASFVQTQKGEWWAVFLGARPYLGNHYNTGRETFLLPVTWRDGWPHILGSDVAVPYVHKRPDLPRHADASAMKAGNFVERDNFDGPRLAPYWTHIRTVREAWHDVASTPGWLTLKARSAHIGAFAQPSFVGRRQQHAYATATTALQYRPVRAGDHAGMVAFQNDDFYYLLAVTLADGRPVIQLEQSGGAGPAATPRVLASAPLTASPGSTLYLRIDANGPTYDFAYAYEPDNWITLKSGVDGTFLSTKTAGGFVGAMLGLYAHAAQPAAELESDQTAHAAVGASAEAPRATQQKAAYAAVPIAGSELRSVHSAKTGRNYDIYVQLPAGYGKDDRTTYPVLYLLDAQWDFKLLASILGGLAYDGFVPPMIVVGVTYSGENADYNALRAMDYTPVALASVAGSGDAPKFHAFLKTELIPLIESEYRVDARRRVLMGSSYGGLFTLYALFKEPELFSAYVASSPSVPYGGRFPFRQAAEYAAVYRDLPVRLFISVGEKEDLAEPVKEYAAMLAARKFGGLRIELRVIAGEGHSSNKPESFNRGLRFAADTSATLRLHRLFQDGMVLQRDVRTPVLGWAVPGAAVTATLAGRSEHTVADSTGAWEVRLPPLKAGGPHTLTVGSAGQEVVVRDILAGDVWVASGQSNMAWPLRSALNGTAAGAAARDSLLREYAVPRSWAEAPRADLAGGGWAPADPQHAPQFSAVGYYFARDLRKATGVPIGVIHTSWGGANVETWMSRAALALSDSAWNALAAHERARDAAVRDTLAARLGGLPGADSGLISGRAAWAAPALDESGWRDIPVPSLWEQAGYLGLDGVVWYRKAFTLTEAAARQPLRISLGRIDDDDITWVNGVEIGRTQGYAEPRVYTVPANALRAGPNVIAVRISDGGGGGGPYGDAADFHVESGGTRQPLAGTWKFRVGEVTFGLDGQRINKIPTVLYNAMLHPLLRFPIKGVIWYQGESNANNSAQAAAYRPLFAELIRSWRREWHGSASEFPFLWVQLPNYGPVDTVPPAQAGWATLRESQTAALELPHTAQAVIMDLGDPKDIHPRDKEPVGHRLALAARRLAYGEQVVASGPTYRAHTVREGKIVIEFNHAAGGLVARSGASVPGFAIAGSDGGWAWADARVDGNRVIVSSPRVPKPVAVRYLWANSPKEVALFNREGLPAAPFRTDTW